MSCWALPFVVAHFWYVDIGSTDFLGMPFSNEMSIKLSVLACMPIYDPYMRVRVIKDVKGYFNWIYDVLLTWWCMIMMDIYYHDVMIFTTLYDIHVF